ncbi:MAG TPA: hypothetical protein VFL31_07505 [Nitrospiraceae bacterium]|nr:hypothetical protein [Nitrospiraceae bacterium]
MMAVRRRKFARKKPSEERRELDTVKIIESDGEKAGFGILKEQKAPKERKRPSRQGKPEATR